MPPFATVGDLAAWLGVEPATLEWLADARGLERVARDERLRHYTYRWVAKRGGFGVRLLEAPKSRTTAVQRKILAGILDAVPPHDAAYGFRRGRSIREHAAAHAKKDVVLKMDLADFFLSVRASRVAALFRTAGYSDDVAWTLAALCTNRAPVVPARFDRYSSAAEIATVRAAETLARTRHLPQGAPTSPAIANLVAYRLDVRLAAASAAVGAVYTRYADDLVFSGDAELARRAPRLVALVGAIATDEGFSVNMRKTSLMRKSSRQRVTGLVVNERPAIARDAYDRLRALLHNCARHGPASQNREGHADFKAHVRGRITFVASVQPARAARHEAIFDRIPW